tara:strand:- start:467 stop:661 length:195 start_codon:yes stop_codon:yes gene_type:complete
MMIGTMVRCPISKIVGVVAPAPEYIPPYADGSVWILVTHSEDGKFVGQVHSWGKDHLEVISESR